MDHGTLRKLITAILALPLGGCAAMTSHDPRAGGNTTVLFLCPYGGAKSVIAASYFNRAARDAGMQILGVAAAAEEPYDAVPAPVADRLQRDGIDVRDIEPHHVTAADVEAAARVIRIDCNLPADLRTVPSESWDDVPKVSVDLEGSVATIRLHVEQLAEALRVRR